LRFIGEALSNRFQFLMTLWPAAPKVNAAGILRCGMARLGCLAVSRAPRLRGIDSGITMRDA